MGEGFMSHANQSLKMNRRERNSIFDKKTSKSGNNQPIILKKKSMRERQQLEEEVKKLEAREHTRLIVAFLMLFIIACLIILNIS